MALVSRISGTLYDSELLYVGSNASTNADLILTVRVRFTPNPPGPVYDLDGLKFQALAWDPAKFQAFKRRAIQQILSVWNERIWLRTPDSFSELDWPRPQYSSSSSSSRTGTHRPNVHCGLRVEEIATPGPIGAHAVVKVAYIPDAVYQPMEEGVTRRRFRSSAYQWCQLDVDESDPLITGVQGQQIVCAHEAGHLLGQDHIGVTMRTPSCISPPKDFFGNSTPMNPNAGACYTAGPLTANIMGVGNNIDGVNGISWQRAMEQHTGGVTSAADWAASTTRFAPRPLAMMSSAGR